MKINLLVQVDLTVFGIASVGTDELTGFVFESYVGYAATRHLLDSERWNAKHLSNPIDVDAKIISDHHRTWSDIWKSANWSVCKDGNLANIHLELDVPDEDSDMAREAVVAQNRYITCCHQEVCMDHLASGQMEDPKVKESFERHDAWANALRRSQISFESRVALRMQ